MNNCFCLSPCIQLCACICVRWYSLHTCECMLVLSGTGCVYVNWGLALLSGKQANCGWNWHRVMLWRCMLRKNTEERTTGVTTHWMRARRWSSMRESERHKRCFHTFRLLVGTYGRDAAMAVHLYKALHHCYRPVFFGTFSLLECNLNENGFYWVIRTWVFNVIFHNVRNYIGLAADTSPIEWRISLNPFWNNHYYLRGSIPCEKLCLKWNKIEIEIVTE